MKILNFVISLIFLSLFNLTYSQENKNEKVKDTTVSGFIGFTIGGTTPLGQYSRVTKPTDGYAIQGYNLRLDWASFGKHGFGETGYLGYFRNNFNPNAANNDTLTSFNFDFKAKNNWVMLLGPSYTINHKKLAIDFKVMAGALIIGGNSYWTVCYFNNSKYKSFTKTYYHDPSIKFAYSFGLNFRLNIARQIQGILAVDYFTSSFTTSYTTELDYNNGSSTLKNYHYYSRINILNINWGLIYSF